MRITAIEPRRKGLRALYLDGEFAVNIDAETLLFSPHRIGQEITDEELHNLIKESDVRRAREKALYLLSHRDHSKKELEDKIVRSGTSGEAARTAALRMEEIGLVNDESFARRYADELCKRKYFSKSRIAYELQKKGIDRDLIHAIIEEMAVDPAQQLRELLARKYARNLQDEKGRRRTVAALQRLGYRWEDIRRALEEFMPDEGREDEIYDGENRHDYPGM